MSGRTGEHVGVDDLVTQPGIRVSGQPRTLRPQRQRRGDVQQPLHLIRHRTDRSRDHGPHQRRDVLPGGRRLTWAVPGDFRRGLRTKDHGPCIPAGQAAIPRPIDFNRQDGAPVVGGCARTRSPRQLAGDPETWPEQPLVDPAGEAVRRIAVALTRALAERGLSLRAAAAGSGVNRQAIADLLAGRSWPDVATVARLIAFMDVNLWPHPPGCVCNGNY
ncbi:helix-turn-helix transcriptional regulator [Streptomyces chrestomyceticus]|uniref:helix-turn-helix domain-containing protein n=1 Tax=Streptomyces chrestomyceticus TaxID=68185 RepID=UPI0033CF4405